MSNFIGNQTISMLSKTLDGLQLRQEAISNNIANVDTPGYKRKDVDFKSQLKAALAEDKGKLSNTNNRHLSTATNLNEFSPEIRTDNNTSFRNDGNNVDIDYEMSALAKNQLKYQSMTKLLSAKFKKLNNAINKVE